MRPLAKLRLPVLAINITLKRSQAFNIIFLTINTRNYFYIVKDHKPSSFDTEYFQEVYDQKCLLFSSSAFSVFYAAWREIMTTFIAE